jgi:hypothetical protein
MKHSQYKYLLIIMAASLVSCFDDLEIDVKPETERIVVNGLINNLDTLSVTVTKSFPPGDDVVVDELENAVVSVYEDDIFRENLVYTKSENDPVGVFKSDFIPDIGHEYKVIVNDDTMGQADAVTYLPVPVKISGYFAQLTDWGSDGWNKPRRYRFSFTLNDPDEKNYYFLRIFMNIYKKETGIDTTKVFTRMNGEVLSSSMPEQTSYIFGGLLFTDEAFNGTAHTITGTATLQDTALICNAIEDWMLTEEEKQIALLDYEKFLVMDIDRLYLQLEVLSEDTYLFYKSHAKAITVNKYSSDLVYKEITPVYGNVENGLGIFGGLKRKIISTWVGGY